MAQPIAILGTGGNALDILDVIEAINRVKNSWNVIGFLDDSKEVGSPFEGYEVLGGIPDSRRLADCHFVNAIGSDRSYRIRPDIFTRNGIDRNRFATLIHPLAAVSARATLGRGTCVNPGVVVAGGVRVGDNVWLGSGSVIGHDTAIEDHALIAPQAVLSGFVRVGSAAYVGAGAAVRQRVSVGENALVGLGAVVLEDVAPGTAVVGNPARVLMRKSTSEIERS